jgi:uncharacterized UPF0160 family protein
MVICTHGGQFHTDDVFAVALLLKKFPGADVIRSREQADFERSDIVVDVGLVYDPEKGRFDHHQGDGAGQRDNGIKYSGFGLIWKHFGLEFCIDDQEVWQRINENLVASIDANDNGQLLYQKNDYDTDPFSLDAAIGLLNPAFDETLDRDEQFHQAVAMATVFLDRILTRTAAAVRADRELVVAYEIAGDKRYIILDHYIPLTKATDDMPELLYSVYPAEIKGWMIQAVNAPKEKFTTRRPLPAAWRGLPKDDLAMLTGIPDITFCHSSGFIGGAESKDAALAMLKLALQD